MRKGLRAMTLASVGGLLLMAPATVAFATTPVDNGCPAAADGLISVAELAPLGYHVPGQIDDPANGGNGDGWVCEFPLPDAVATAWGEGGIQIYMFFENNLPAEGRP
jgi:hypothetical protein